MKRQRPRLAGGLGWLVFTSAVALLSAPRGLGSTNSLNHFSVRIWQTDDGLPQNSVKALAQTSDGYLWVGTQEGLARFDGMRFVVVEEPAAPELRHGHITALCAARDGGLWIGCEGAGLFRLKDGKFWHFSEADGLTSNQPRGIIEAKDGGIWIGTENGVSLYKDGKFTNFSQKNGLGDNSVRALCQDHRGLIRVATRRGLSSVNQEQKISTMNFYITTTANALRSVCEDHLGNIWVSSNEGVTRDGEQGRKFYSKQDGLPDRIATALLEDSDGRVWVGTYSGLACLVDGEVVCKPMNEAGFGDLVNTLFEDREGTLWAGARDGLYCIKPARFASYTTLEGLTCNNAMSVREDRDGAIWIATWSGGVNELKDGKFITYGATNGLTHDSALSLEEGSDGSIWIGMDFDGGLNRLKNGEHSAFSAQNGLVNAAVLAIHEDRHGALWIGTKGGLVHFKDGKFTTYTAGKGLAGNTNNVILENAKGELWFGMDGGLSRWNAGKFVNFTTAQGLSHNFVNSLFEDSEHTLWIGTKGGGLNRFKDGKFTAYTTRQGMFNDEIFEILEDDSGHFWMSCRNGIFRVRKKDFDDVDAGRSKLVTSTVFGKADGLPSVQCNGVSKPAGWKSRDGRLWFPTIRGVVAIESRIKTNEHPPPVTIEGVLADRKPLDGFGIGADVAQSAATNVTIAPGRGELEIHYTALSLRAAEKNRFKYILENADSDWVDAGSRREAYYTKLGPGKYRFHVIASNNDGVWNEAGATLSFVFLPHFWQTWWFKLSIPAVAAVLLAIAYHVRVGQLREIERLRIQIAADLHDDVGSRLTKVGMVTETLDHETPSTERTKPYVENIARTTREVIQAMDEIVWTINPKNDTLDNLANYIFQYAQEYFQNTGVRCRLDLPAKMPDHPLSTEERHNLFMAVKEALNNVLKHASASEVRIGLAAQNGSLMIHISDNGCGFALEGDHSNGNGLDNMKERLARIGGRIEFESKPGGGGTRVEMETPLR
jgi:ligand-binding sensor domain-containing protein/signal transduction histidine kinase